MNNEIKKQTYLLGFAVLYLFYGALIPFEHWSSPDQSVLNIVLYGWLNHIFLFDIVQNLLFFIPYGLFASSYLRFKQGDWPKIFLLVTLLSLTTSTFIECLQTYNPARIPSLLDISLNTISGFLGTLLAIPYTRHYQALQHWLDDTFQANTPNNRWPLLGLSVGISWALYQLYPFIPNLQFSQFHSALIPLLAWLKGDSTIQWSLFAQSFIQGMLLFFAAKLIVKPIRFHTILTGFVLIIFTLKLSMTGLIINAEEILGVLSALMILCLGQRLWMNEGEQPQFSGEALQQSE